MSDLIPYQKRYSMSDTRLYLTGKRKRVTISYENGRHTVIEFLEHRVHFLGIPLWTQWIDKDHIEWRKVEVEIYEDEDLKNG